MRWFVSATVLILTVPIAIALPGFAVTPNLRSYSVEDFNQDGIPDLVTAHSDGRISITLGNEDGSFTAGPGFQLKAQPVGIVAGKINNDKYPDLVIWSEASGARTPNHSGAEVTVVFGAPHLLFVPFSTSFTDINPILGNSVEQNRPILALKNIDGDQHPDLVVNFSSASCKDRSDRAIAFEIDRHTAKLSRLNLPKTPVTELVYPQQLVAAASDEPRLEQQMRNPYFVTELALLGMSYAALKLPTTPNVQKPLNFFLDTAWTAPVCKIPTWKKAGAQLYEFIQGVRDSAHLLKFSRYLLDAARKDPKLTEDVKNPEFTKALLNLGQAYAALDVRPSDPADDLNFFLDTLWKASAERTRQR
jgi:hypothetical protein